MRLPEGVDGLCCGMAFASKGLHDAARAAARRTAEALWRASGGGRLTVVTDASPCAGTLGDAVAEALREDGRDVRMLDFPAFWAREVLRGLSDTPRRPGTAILHPTCTLLKEGGLADLLAVARAHAERVEVPRFAECCGFAGDRGFLVPELTASATEVEAAEIRRLLERRPGGRSVLHVPHLRDRPVAGGGPSRAVAPAPRARGRLGCLTPSSTPSPRCPSSRPTWC